MKKQSCFVIVQELRFS